ncbi:MAG: N-acetylmuramoyl-L-alanine amidase [Deltaproteobacteria bacterium]|nr:N-acetylmuramoyl-L-alanine amidase [Deltaproteobacteria bacterium]
MFAFLLAVALLAQVNPIELKQKAVSHKINSAKANKVRAKPKAKPNSPKKPAPAVAKPTLSLDALLNKALNESESEPEPLRIVVDAGHGGADSGAVGRSGLKEKDITLAVAKEVKQVVKKRLPKAKIFLTREDDKTLSLASRADFANHMKADLFISIHVNSSENRKAQGVETYYLNISHDRYALRLAARENAMTETETSHLEYILADLAMKSSVTDSVRLGRMVQNALCGNLMRKYRGVKDLGLKHAMFYVLMGAKMPAVLVETSFISNRMEEKRLKQHQYQRALAEGIVNGIQLYSEQHMAMR